MPTTDAILDLRAAAFAEDVVVSDDMLERMTKWSEEDIETFYESGGQAIPLGEEPCDSPAPKSQDIQPDSCPAELPELNQPESKIDLTDAAAGSTSDPTDASVASSDCTDAAAAPSLPDLSGLSIKQLKARCAAAGLLTDDCVTKSDLVKRAMEASATGSGSGDIHVEAPSAPAASPAEEWWAAVSTKDMKRRLEHAGINTSACYERSDFEVLARLHPCAGEARGSAASRSGAAATAVSDAPSSGSTTYFWSGFSVKELKQLLADRHVSTAGCIDKSDLLAAAERNKAVLLTSVVTAPSTAIDPVKAQLAAEKKEKIRAGLEALGGVVHGGYQIDMFGAKRGRCLQNPKCFRYMPGNTKVNGCAMKGMGAVTCQRCGYQNMDHEHLGDWREGEPMLVDENGDGWRFESCVEGTRKVKMERPPPPAKR